MQFNVLFVDGNCLIQYNLLINKEYLDHSSMEKNMFMTKTYSRFLMISLLGFGLALNGCSYMPWVGGNDKEEDLTFEKDSPTGQKQEDDFFAEEGKGKEKDKEAGFVSTDQATDVHETKTDVQDIQQRQEALVQKVKDLEEMLHTLQPKVEATQQKLEGGLGAMSQKSEYLEPEVKELRSQLARLNEELNELKSGKGRGKAAVGMKKKGAIPPEYTKAHRAYMSGNYDESIVMFQNLAVKNPPKNLQDNIAYWIGANYAKLGKYDEAIKQFQVVLTKYADGNKVHDSQFMLGYCYLKKGDKARAVDTFEAALKNHPPKDVREKIESQLKEIQ